MASAMLGQNLPPPGWKVKVSENLGATTVAPVAPADTSLTMENGILLNFGKRYENNLRVIFDQWLKLHLGLDTLLRNQKS